MKNIVIGLLLVTTVVFGVLWSYQGCNVTQAQWNAAGLQQNVTDLQTSLAEREKQNADLGEQLNQARIEVDAKHREAAQLKAALEVKPTNQPPPEVAAARVAPTPAKPSNPFADVFKNPEMKEMIKTQQKTVLGPMIEKNYGRLFADLRLTPEQSSAFKDLILNKQLGAAEMGLSMLSGDNDPAKRADMAQQMKSANEAADAQIKEFLGDENFAQFQSYEKTMPERMAVTGLKDQLGAGSIALTDGQELQLVQALTQERESFKFTTDLSDKSQFNGDLAAMFNEEKLDLYLHELEQLNQRYETRAQTILSADQLTAFNKYINNQQALQKAGMQMAVKMFGTAKSGE